jgi:hypothetical protein
MSLTHQKVLATLIFQRELKHLHLKPGFNPKAKDGDKDGFVQDGTPHERPVSTTTPSAASDLTL